MKNNILLLTLLLSLLVGETVPDIPIKKEFIEPGRVDALAPYPDNQTLYLVQFDLHNDSLFNLITNSISDLDLLNGPASYQRILPEEIFITLPLLIDENYYRIIRENYIQPDIHTVGPDPYYNEKTCEYEIVFQSDKTLSQIAQQTKWWLDN